MDPCGWRIFIEMLPEGFEPPCLSAPVSETGVSSSFTTGAELVSIPPDAGTSAVAFRNWTETIMVGAAGLAPATSSSRNWRSSLSELRSVHGRPAGSCTPILRRCSGYPGCWTTGRGIGGRGRTRTFIGRVRAGYAALHHAPDVGATGIEPACFRLVLQRYRLP